MRDLAAAIRSYESRCPRGELTFPSRQFICLLLVRTALRSTHCLRTVTCIEAEIDLRVGGRYRIGNRFRDGSVLWISVKFEVIDASHKLVYTWRIGTDSREELVSVSFRATTDGKTEVRVVHERIPDIRIRDGHEQGWLGCLSKLNSYLT